MDLHCIQETRKGKSGLWASHIKDAIKGQVKTQVFCTHGDSKAENLHLEEFFCTQLRFRLRCGLKAEPHQKKTLFVKVPTYIFSISETAVFQKKPSNSHSTFEKMPLPCSFFFAFIIIDAVWQTKNILLFSFSLERRIPPTLPLLDWNRHLLFLCTITFQL